MYMKLVSNSQRKHLSFTILLPNTLIYIHTSANKLYTNLGASHVALGGLLVELVEGELGIIGGLLGGTVPHQPHSLLEALVEGHVCMVLLVVKREKEKRRFVGVINKTAEERATAAGCKN
jgi:hypothetical protein